MRRGAKVWIEVKPQLLSAKGSPSGTWPGTRRELPVIEGLTRTVETNSPRLHGSFDFRTAPVALDDDVAAERGPLLSAKPFP